MFVKHEQNTLVIIQYIACGGEPEHRTKFQEMKNLIKGQSDIKLPQMATAIYSKVSVWRFISTTYHPAHTLALLALY